MVIESSGILLYKFIKLKPYVFLVFPGGPFFKGKDREWRIPKGRVEKGEERFSTAIREIGEELGIKLKSNRNKFQSLGSIKTKSGRVVYIWALEKNWDGNMNGSSYVKMEYPKGSNRIIKFLEVTKGKFFSIEEAKKNITPTQIPFINRLEKLVEKRKKRK